MALPQTAVMDGPQGKFVYVTAKDKDGKDIAAVRPVVVGDWVDADGGNLWVIESGLKAGDVVIVDGIAKLMPGGPIKLGGAPAGAGAPGAAPGAAGAAPGAAGAAPGAASAAGASAAAAPDKAAAKPIDPAGKTADAKH